MIDLLTLLISKSMVAICRFYCVLFLFFISTSKIRASDNLRSEEIRSLTLGGVGAVLSVRSNPSFSSFLSDGLVQINYFNRFSMKELSTLSGDVFYPNKILNALLSISTTGYDQFRETNMNISVNRLLTKSLSLGVGINYRMATIIAVDEKPSRLSLDIGMTYEFNEKFMLGCAVQDAPSFILQEYSDGSLPFYGYCIRMGGYYSISNTSLVTAEVAYLENDGMSFRTGLEYTPISAFDLRVGFCTKPLQPSFGMGYSFRNMNIDALALYHQQLGISSGVSLSYMF